MPASNATERNELTAEKSIPAWRKFLAQFHDALVILLLNALMGYIQQSRAEQAVAALRLMSAAHANVIRGGVRQSIAAAEVVPGDIILIEEGDTVPADARLIQETALRTAEAALTGESLPVDKEIAAITGEAPLGDQDNMIFSGTAATYGRGKAVVTATRFSKGESRWATAATGRPF